MEATLWAVDRAARAAQPELRLGDLRRRRLDARAHARTVARIVRETPLKPAAHLTCVAATEDGGRRGRRAPIGTRACATSWRCAAIRPAASAPPTSRIPAATSRPAISSPASSRSAISRSRSRPIPEKHPEAASLEADIDVLKRKVDCGADRAITQFFFDNDLYFRYVDRVRARGIDIPIVPGILPVQNFKQAANFAARAGASVPGVAGSTVRGARPGCRHPQAHRRRGRGRAGARPRRPRRQRVPLLHHEPRRPRLRDLPSPRPAAAGRGGREGGGLKRPGEADGG